jgi:hypothetical protein
MKKQITFSILLLFLLSVTAQEKKSKTYEQHRSAESGRYVTKKETKVKPSTTYTVKRKKR